MIRKITIIVAIIFRLKSYDFLLLIVDVMGKAEANLNIFSELLPSDPFWVTLPGGEVLKKPTVKNPKMV